MTAFVFALQRVGTAWTGYRLSAHANGMTAQAVRRALTGTC